MSDHLLDEIANDLNSQGKPTTGAPKYDAGGLWVFLTTLAVYLLYRYC